MPAESERPPYFNGDSGQTRGAKDVDAPSEPAPRSVKEDITPDMSTPTAKSQGQAMSQVPKLVPSIPVSSSTSTTNSAVSSRESSPVRYSTRSMNTSTSRVHSQSRRSSQDRASPVRSFSNSHSSGIPVHTSPSGQRGSTQSNNTPFFSPPPPAPDPPANVLSPEKNMPPWSANRRTDQDSTPPNTSQKRIPLPPSEEEHGTVDRSTPRPVARGVSGQGPSLETVQEMASNPSTPSSDTALKPVTPDDARLHTIDEDPTPRAAKKKQNAESGSDSGENRSSEAAEEGRSQATGGTKTPKTLMPQRSSTSLSAGARGKPADGSVRNMIVETETVSSIPQVSLGVGAGERGHASRGVEQGTLKNKRSTDTVRAAPVSRGNPPKKKRRPNALPTGPTSSKADIFEAKVASAVDEADVSDSDETFVYESNPIDYPPRRYHSRTPSATSMASQVDQLAGRARLPMRDGNHSVTIKRSMKFTNNSHLDGESVDSDSRSVSRVDGSGTITPGRGYHHIGPRTRPPSIMDNDGLFPQGQGQKSPRHFISGHRHSRNSNTRSSPNYRSINGSKKAGDIYGYDFDAEGADDERTPLVSRPPRSSRGDRIIRRPGGTSRQIEYITQQQRGCFSRYGSCTIILLLLLIIAGGAVSFFIAASKTLLDVQVIAIENVLASEQEIMLDLNVSAINPNIFPVTIDDTDLNIFAKSRFVGTDKLWREHRDDELDGFPRVKQSRRRWELSRVVRCLGNMDCVKAAMSGHSSGPHTNDGVDEGTDPISDPEGDAQTMLLGRVFRFDSPLSFPAAPWGKEPFTSKAQIRLGRPGNKTEEGGTERWERVLQHPFELIVRGVIKYPMPLSSLYHSESISATVKYVPNEDSDDPDTTPPSNETARISTKANPSLRLLDHDAQPELRPVKFKRQFTA
ncbi:hypothetical protein N7478_002727 [Penicillium angulare]|uniref:uncharacterized protein n=1 Tax=Penicillium angulare TaxID=116970 RepID=UPI00253FF339|nr:uncharacterized protein N7478_002727 [Penicillium angulare]KAJ5287041.1 hypothetical protein N7478_002727 [Penicillium angulare]